ncbi:MAG: dipicolinate synthase subunit B [Clostridiaceae bacterium]|nr:dipicolinate synthase subunit B [Clostridiaceae bacterium]
MTNTIPERIAVGFAITGSFCTFSKILDVLKDMMKKDFDITPIFSEKSSTLDNRFFEAEDFVAQVQEITRKKGIFTIPEAEPIGPKGYLDVLVIAPCTGNTLAKLCSGITDSPVLMAAKAHLRNEKPLIISISTNDALGMNFCNLGKLMNTKNIYFVPFGQDNYKKKSNSLIAHTDLIPDTIYAALKGRQLQPVIQSPFACCDK